ncbi:MAG: efflux RND transporter periplasmic adaptor subunit [Gammaproteobacteria bacterium]|nr:efflux RND transporter periplasmic adaptor subunit [Gammaproteobacteria bacterium]
MLITTILVTAIIGVLAGHWLWPDDKPTDSISADDKREILYWVAPMDSNFRRDAPGKSPMGMDLVPVYASSAPAGAGVVEIAPHIVNNLGVRTTAVAYGALSQKIAAVGYIRPDENSVQHVHTRVDGWIEELQIDIGERVKKGQVLFRLYAPTLIAAQEEYLAAVRSGNRTLINASRDRLESLGLGKSQLDSLRKSGRAVERMPVYASRDGIVDELNARSGMYVQPSTTVISTYSLDSVWLVAEFFERDSTWLVDNADAEIKIDALPGRTWSGVIDYVYPSVDPVMRTLKARIILDNPDGLLRPNMHAIVSILGSSLPQVIHIPTEALIRGARQDRVVVALEEGRYQSRVVETGMTTRDRVQIRTGLEPDDRVVVSGQFLIDSESNIETDLARVEGRGRQ